MTAHAPNLRLVTKDFVPTAGLTPRKAQRLPERARKPLGQILLDMKAVDPGNMLKAVALRDRQEVRLGDILLAHSWVNEADLMAALSLLWGVRVVDLVAEPPDPRLIDRFGADFCLREGLIPWRQIGAAMVVATARPEDFARLRAQFPEGDPYLMALAPERDIHAAMLAARQTALIRRAETRVRPEESCRTLGTTRLARGFLPALAAVCLVVATVPAAAFVLFFGWAVLSLILCSGLKALAFADTLHRHFRPAPPTRSTAIARLPIVSVMVPLFQEDDIAPRLIRRLGTLDYPKELLDILLVVEETDQQTRRALAAHRLPRWMRVVNVPDGPIRTKPRALNYALDFCRGSIVGVYDAEDAPDPGQLRAVVRRFHERGADVACLQGILDFYNARHNWLSRCFTIEYAAWFRVMLPGLARLGYVIPLGGTTLFFRRKALEELGGWDAHNVTEDADLGLRLARHGYRTEFIETVTEEEPNAEALPWIRQRSRWLKGYAMTWASHMRDPARIWRELGARRFLGMQILFLGTLSQYVLAPVLWSFWAITLGFGHPFQEFLPTGAVLGLSGLFIASELLNIAVGLWAVRGPHHRHLMAWVPTLQLYFPLGALASYKALWEAAFRPFFWDKTRHGMLDTEVAPAPLPLLRLENPILPAPADRPSAPPPPAVSPPRRSVITHPALVPGIEFQTSFEGF